MLHPINPEMRHLAQIRLIPILILQVPIIRRRFVRESEALALTKFADPVRDRGQAGIVLEEAAVRDRAVFVAVEREDRWEAAGKGEARDGNAFSKDRRAAASFGLEVKSAAYGGECCNGFSGMG